MADIYLPGRSSYAAAKAALIGYFGCLRTELINKNINITVLIPGRLKTNLTTKALDKNGNPIGGNSEMSGFEIDKAAIQALSVIKKRKYMSYIGEKDKTYLIWRLNKLFPNYITEKLLKKLS